MGFFPLDLKKILGLVVIIIIPVMIINVQHKPGELVWYMKPLYFVSTSLQNIYVGFSSQVRGTTSDYLNLVHIKKENQTLLNDVSILKAKLVQLEEIRLENTRFSKMLDFDSHSDLCNVRLDSGYQKRQRDRHQ